MDKKIVVIKIDEDKYLIKKHISRFCDLSGIILDREQLFNEVNEYSINGIIALDDVLEIRDINNNIINNDELYDYFECITVLDSLIN